MDSIHDSISAVNSAAANGNSVPPFLSKTYDMVDDSSTNSVVTWSNSGNSFVVWSVPEFARDLLPKYFKHSNFSSFVRQLNTYVGIASFGIMLALFCPCLEVPVIDAAVALFSCDFLLIPFCAWTLQNSFSFLLVAFFFMFIEFCVDK